MHRPCQVELDFPLVFPDKTFTAGARAICFLSGSPQGLWWARPGIFQVDMGELKFGLAAKGNEKLSLVARVLAAAVSRPDIKMDPAVLAERLQISEQAVELALGSDEYKAAVRDHIKVGILGLAAKAVGMAEEALPKIKDNPDMILKALRTLGATYEKFSGAEEGHNRTSVLAAQDAFLNSIKPAQFQMKKASDAATSEERRGDGSAGEAESGDRGGRSDPREQQGTRTADGDGPERGPGREGHRGGSGGDLQ